MESYLFSLADRAAHSNTFYTDAPAWLLRHFEAHGEPSFWERACAGRWEFMPGRAAGLALGESPDGLLAEMERSGWEMVAGGIA